MARMIAIGPERFTLPLAAIGFEPVDADAAGFVAALRRLTEDRSVGLIACGESLVRDDTAAEFRQLCSTAKAAVLVLPDGPEPRGIGFELVRSLMERAAGADLLSSVTSEQ